ncbi:innexin inx2 isoform X2 [Eurytemora carolleeae]|uniref:innexin inx2 isoform X2 n=1 Tax=Eurytemora carolleeae TaxID=1294199 RepID=UPI000C78C7C8|nr:innexin inx2 isoform X2 [Eurytemora carolleeae]|eukprot:XP_023325021.1 innexin inx2-like isoform X2 [Eurytemora affinis]
MAEILGAATTATKLFLEVNQVSIDNWTFKLFYKATTTLLLALSVVSTSKQFFGDPISCDVRKGGVNQDVLNSYCWMYSNFNIPPDFKGSCAKREYDGATLYNTYYQWVSLYLVFEAILFYLPRSIWLMLEGGLMKFLAKGARGKIIEDACEKRENLLRTFQEHLHNKYNSYAAGFICCEVFNVVIVLSQIFVTNRFLNHKFLDYGPQVYSYYSVPPEERLIRKMNPMCETFPRIAACDYIRFGSGGGQENINAICILGLNMINDKIFLVLWYWYFFLLFLGSTRIVYRVVQLLSSRIRYQMMKMKMHRYFKNNENIQHIKHYVYHCSIGDWFVLYQMSRNMNRRFFADFLVVLSKRVNPHPNAHCDEHPFFTETEINQTTDVGETCDNSVHAHLDITYMGEEDKEDKESEKTNPGPKDVLGF